MYTKNVTITSELCKENASDVMYDFIYMEY